jgi:hypothetical protein
MDTVLKRIDELERRNKAMHDAIADLQARNARLELVLDASATMTDELMRRLEVGLCSVDTVLPK